MAVLDFLTQDLLCLLCIVHLSAEDGCALCQPSCLAHLLLQDSLPVDDRTQLALQAIHVCLAVYQLLLALLKHEQVVLQGILQLHQLGVLVSHALPQGDNRLFRGGQRLPALLQLVVGFLQAHMQADNLVVGKDVYINAQLSLQW